ncbi:truncated response regulator [Lactobacillus acetotolerans]|uniref:Truncated response regulator n=1 Tax=Lactobacillus acetotolerans TaxID=1600 RepID=A0A0D6A3Q8_9LACO|nr:truncated response regulator [Lactobacillus acetotolerans]
MGLKILMVEDDNSVAEMMGMFLKKKDGLKMLLPMGFKQSICLRRILQNMI